MCNVDIRDALKKNNLKQWQLARLLEISEATLVRKLRFELSAEEKEKIFSIIKEVKE